jgi:hypothetical protein
MVLHCAILPVLGATAESIGAPRGLGTIRTEVLVVIVLSSQVTAQVGADYRAEHALARIDRLRI